MYTQVCVCKVFGDTEKPLRLHSLQVITAEPISTKNSYLFYAIGLTLIDNIQRLQLLVAVAQTVYDTLHLLVIQRPECPKHPLRLGADYNHAVIVSDHNLGIGISPTLLNLIEIDLNDYSTNNPVWTLDRVTEVIATFFGRATQSEIAPRLALHRIGKIGPKTKIAADKTGLFLPVTRGRRCPVSCHHVDIKRMHQFGRIF